MPLFSAIDMNNGEHESQRLLPSLPSLKDQWYLLNHYVSFCYSNIGSSKGAIKPIDIRISPVRVDQPGHEATSYELMRLLTLASGQTHHCSPEYVLAQELTEHYEELGYYFPDLMRLQAFCQVMVLLNTVRERGFDTRFNAAKSRIEGQYKLSSGHSSAIVKQSEHHTFWTAANLNQRAAQVVYGGVRVNPRVTGTGDGSGGPLKNKSNVRRTEQRRKNA